MVLKSRSWAKDQVWFYKNQQQEEIVGKRVKQHNMIAHKLWFLVEVKTLLVKHYETILHYNPLSYFNGVNSFSG